MMYPKAWKSPCTSSKLLTVTGMPCSKWKLMPRARVSWKYAFIIFFRFSADILRAPSCLCQLVPSQYGLLVSGGRARLLGTKPWFLAFSYLKKVPGVLSRFHSWVSVKKKLNMLVRGKKDTDIMYYVLLGSRVVHWWNRVKNITM